LQRLHNALSDWLQRWLRRLRALKHRDRMWREMEDEMRFHLERETEQLVRDGMSPGEARREARLRFGGVERFKEYGREARGVRPLEDLVQDLRYALRGLRRAPAFAAAAILTLGLGIGANTAIFSVVDGVLLKPLPYPEPDRLVRVFQQSRPSNRWGLSDVDFLAIEAEQRSFSAVAGLRPGEVTLSGPDGPSRVWVGFVTAAWFDVLDVRPQEGHGFRPEDDRPGSPPQAVITHAFRQRYFGEAGDVVGRNVVLDGESYSVVGVLAPGVRSLGGWRADIWPVRTIEPPTRRGPFGMRVVARLRPGVSLPDAARDLGRISERIFPLWSDTFQDSEARLTPEPLREVMIGDVERALLLLFGAVAFVLVIAVANVANLFLSRASGRQREVALRTSLGATRGRLTRQLLVESTTLAVLGGLVGFVLAAIALDALLAIGPRLPRLEEVGLDFRVLAFTGLVTFASGALFGLAPLLHGLTSDLAATLRARGSIGSTGKRASALRGSLVVAEFALALPLLAGGVLLFTSLERMQRVDPGFDPENVMVARTAPAATKYPDARSVIEFWNQALPAVAAIPGVVAVGISSGLPPSDPNQINNFDLLDRPVPQGTTQPAVPWLSVSPGYFDVLGVPLLRGRLPDLTDVAGAPPVVAVSRSWAERFYPGEEVLGKQMYSGGNRTQPVTVVGVVGDVKYLGLARPDEGAVYSPLTQSTWRAVNLVVRTRGPSVTMRQVRDRLHELDPDLPLANVQTMGERLSAAVERPRYWATLVGVFAALGVALAALGIYGVLSYSVSRQSRDIGIRMALGADSGAVRRMVVRRGMIQAAVGLGIGLAAALPLTRWLEGLLYDVSPTDPIAFGAVSLLLLIIALAACYWPARRASKVDPVQVLAEE